MTKLSAKPVRLKIEEDLKTRILKLKNKPKLAVVLVGEDPASVIYTTKKGEKAVSLGMEHETIKFPASTSPEEVKSKLDELNADATVSGILIQRPLPKSFKEEDVVYWVAPEKDVDAFHPENKGRLTNDLPCFKPCTPAGVMEILEHYKINPEGQLACIVGRSTIVGKPMAALLLQANATVIQCHSRTKNLHELTSQADILVAAIGKPKFLKAEHIKPGSTVIDVGIHRQEDGKLCGDVDPEAAASKAGAATPVPGGVGPMTIAVLMKNTVEAAERQHP